MSKDDVAQATDDLTLGEALLQHKELLTSAIDEIIRDFERLTGVSIQRVTVSNTEVEGDDGGAMAKRIKQRVIKIKLDL